MVVIDPHPTSPARGGGRSRGEVSSLPQRGRKESPLPWRGRARVGAARRAGEEEEAVARLVPSPSGGGQGWGLLSPLPNLPPLGGQGWELLGERGRRRSRGELVPSLGGGGQGWGFLSPLPTSPAGGGQGWGLLGDQRRTGSAKSSAASASPKQSNDATNGGSDCRRGS
jgi:hypothetical protein